MSIMCAVEKEKSQGDLEMMPLAWALGCPFMEVMKTGTEGSSIPVWKHELQRPIRRPWGSQGSSWRFHFGGQRRNWEKGYKFYNCQNMVNI